MPEYSYLIIGGGMTAASAVKGIREVDPNGSIGMISAESHLPYKRPPLTKKLWMGKPESSVWMDLPQENLEVILDCQVKMIDPKQKVVQDMSGKEYRYGRLLLATGGSPRRLPFGPESVLYYRTLDDYKTVRSWTQKGARIGVIGGGFIGSEIAAALATNHESVVMVFPESAIGARIYPADLSSFITTYFQEKGVEVHAGTEIQDIQQRGEGLVMVTKNGQEIAVDHIIAGIGITPNISLAKAAGLEIAGQEAGGGIQVDETLHTSQPDIFAAGDVASFFNPTLNRRMRVEHEDNSVSMGHAAGLNMAGQDAPYLHQPYFYSDLFELGYEAVGDLNSSLETYADWQEPFRKGVVYYLKDGQVRGVLLWDTWDQVNAASQLIREGKRYEKTELKGRLPEK